MQRLYVHVEGGCYRGADHVPANCTIQVIDWDNLLADDAAPADWKRLDREAQQFIMKNYPTEYRIIAKRLRSV